jgi:hypothetical protein
MDPHRSIKEKQIKMSRRYVDKKPSRVKDIAWIYATSSKEYPQDTERSGKYLIFVTLDQVDVVWEIIKRATIEGLLGDSSKVSTHSQRKQHHSQQHVICVYTYDCTDRDDRQRIEGQLMKLGFMYCVYKTNTMTLGL